MLTKDEARRIAANIAGAAEPMMRVLPINRPTTYRVQ
jgi:hypothetical protein